MCTPILGQYARPVRSFAMSGERLAALRVAYATASADRERFARVFYRRLFGLDPALPPLFTTEMRTQGAKLVDMLDQLIAAADAPSRIRSEIEDLGRRHAEYGVRPGHYALVGAALTGTFAEILGDDCDEHALRGLVTLYGAVSAVMLEGAARP
jgi:hemoglobin-like flavoprotein